MTIANAAPSAPDENHLCASITHSSPSRSARPRRSVGSDPATSGSVTAAMIADMREALEAVLGPISEPVLLPGGASKEAWAVDADGEPLLVRRAGGGVIHRHTLSLRHEFEVLRVAHAAGVNVPRPVAYIEDLEGREAFVMERLEGETIGRRIVRMAVPDRLPEQMAEELAKIHALRPQRLPFLENASVDRPVEELDEIGEPPPDTEPRPR